jgi:AraC family transcriptional regulator
MTVDIEVKQTPGYNVAYLSKVGSEGTDPLRREFNELTSFAKKQKRRAGKWIFYFYEGGRSPSRYRFEACLEVPKRAKPQGKIKVKELPAATVASVKFNPDHVAPRLVYNGVYGWLKENEKYKEGGSYSREIYFGNPWTDSWAWARTEIQVPVKKKGR